jgi:hypothetical protein
MIKKIQEIEEIQETPAIIIPESFPSDKDATWVYWTDSDTLDAGISEEWVWERLRLRRDKLLTDTDYRMVSDAPWDVQPWAQYRQALRDLPKATKNPTKAVWPEVPA